MIRLIGFNASVLGLVAIAAMASVDARTPNPSFPDLTGLEPAVAIQLEELQQILLDTLSDDAATPREQADIYGELGRHYQAYELTVPAEEFYQQALQLVPGRFEWLYYLAHLLQQQGRLEEAEGRFRHALELVPRDLPTLVGLANLYLRENRLDEAESFLQIALQVDPLSPAVQTAVGELALAQGRYDAAVEAFAKALESVPAANRLHYLLGMAYRGSGDLERAREHLAQRGPIGVKVEDPLMSSLQDLKRGETVYLLRGRRAYRVGQYQEAMEAFRLAVEAAPDSVRARVNLGTALAAGGDHEAGIKQFEKALEIDPDNATAWFNLGNLRASAGSLEQARLALQRAVELEPTDAIAHLELGDLLLRLDRSEPGLEHFEAAIALDPGLERARLGEAEALVRLGRFVETRTALEEAHHDLPTSGLVARALARLLTECPEPALRDGGRALPLAQMVYEARPTADSARTVALAYAELGHCAEAVGWRDRAINAAEAAGDLDQSEALRVLLTSYPWVESCSPSRDD